MKSVNDTCDNCNLKTLRKKRFGKKRLNALGIKRAVQCQVCGKVYEAKPENKYGAKAMIVDGIRFDSKKEARYYGQLKLLQKLTTSDRLERFERQVRYPIRLRGEIITTYIVDFIEHYADGRTVYTDVKGMKFGAAYQLFTLKKKLMKAVYGIEIKEV
jgi:hypothetical protein